MKKWLFAGLLILLTGIYLYDQQNRIQITHLTYSGFTPALDGTVIVHLSDLHTKSFGTALTDHVAALSPDVIVFTGDLYDQNNTGTDAPSELLGDLTTIAPVYFVSGNHEQWAGITDSLATDLTQRGVTVLDNKQATMTIHGEKLTLSGLADPAGSADESAALSDSLAALPKVSGAHIVLSHRPEAFPVYVANDLPLVFSGHAHGGQFRLPLIGGIIAPDQGLFPDFTEGAITKDRTTMIVSRGLGNSIIPLRIHNRPEIVVVTLDASN